MTDSVFLKAFNYMLQNEGGLTEDPNDPGGATHYGISEQFLKACYKRGSIWADLNHDGKIDKEDIILINKKMAQRIYEVEFWDKVKNIPNDLLAIKVFDASVNIGTSNAVKRLQKVLNVKQDGIIGEKTISAIKKMDINKLFHEYIESLQCYYYKLVFWYKPKLDGYLKGWLNRAAKIPT